MKSNLSKTDYVRFNACPTAGYYGWSELESRHDSDEFLRYLGGEAETVRRLARRLFAEVRTIRETAPRAAHAETTAALASSERAVCGGCVVHGELMARPSLLMRRDGRLFLFHVAAKIGDLAAHREGKMLINYYGDIRAAYRELVHALAYESEVVRRAMRGLAVVPYFILPEGSARAQAEEVAVARSDAPGHTDNADIAELKRRRAASVLKFYPASAAVEKIRGQTRDGIEAMLDARRRGTRPEPRLRYQCRNCEFRLKNGRDPGDGFHRCWGSLATPRPHIFDLYQLYSLKSGRNRRELLADEKIRAGATALGDIAVDELHGEHAARQRMQLAYGERGEEWIDPRLGERIAELRWPVAFMDFETILAAVPWYAGLKPHEVLPFQFSVHILHADGRAEHREWLNTRDRNPVLPFIRALRAALEGTGSILVYTDYENRILKEAAGILRRLHLHESAPERSWIAGLLESGRIVDQHDWVYRYYFHPLMGGRTSIKAVLPAVWGSNPSLHAHPVFRQYYRCEDGTVIDPYKVLPPARADGVECAVREGCGAMQAYRELILGRGARCARAKESLATALRDYVTLDTASQWMLFEHWRQRLGMTEPAARNTKTNLQTL